MTAVATGLASSTNWVFEGAWLVLAIFVHAVFIVGMPKRPYSSGMAAPGDLVDLSFVEASREPEEVEAPDPVTPPPKRRMSTVVTKTPSPKAPPAASKSVEGPAGIPDGAISAEGVVGVVGAGGGGVVGGVIGGTGRGVVIDTGDLSREHVAPLLNRTLKRLKPDHTGAIGAEGEAFIRLQVGADGVPSDWHVVLEHPLGYELGRTCIDTLKKESWQAPLDENGKPVTKRIIYRCGYEIRY